MQWYVQVNCAHFPQLCFQWYHVSSLQSTMMVNLHHEIEQMLQIRVFISGNSSYRHAPRRVWFHLFILFVLYTGPSRLAVSLNQRCTQGTFFIHQQYSGFFNNSFFFRPKRDNSFLPCPPQATSHFFHFSKPAASNMAANSSVPILATSWCVCQSSVTGKLNVLFYLIKI